MSEFLMRLIAGKRHAWWLHPDTSAALSGLGNAQGAALTGGAALGLVQGLKQMGKTGMTADISDADGYAWRVSVERMENSDQR